MRFSLTICGMRTEKMTLQSAIWQIIASVFGSEMQELRMKYMVGVLLGLMLSPVVLGVTVITRYVDTDDGDNGNGGTSWGDAWASMDYAESEIDDYGENSDGDFTATGATYPTGIQVTLHCRGETGDTNDVDWRDLDTDATHYMEIIGDGEYTLAVSNERPIYIETSFLRFENLNVHLSSANSDGDSLVVVYNIAGDCDIRFISCIFQGPDNDSYECCGIHVNDVHAVVSLNNCLIYDVGQNASSAGVRCQQGETYGYNTTIHNAYVGVRSGDEVYCKNTIVSGSDGNAYTQDIGDTLQLWNCTADDATASTYDQGSDCHDSVTPTYTGSRYQLDASDSTWIDGGADLGEDSYWFDDDVDYDDDARDTWDIGYDEYVSSGVSIPIVMYHIRRR